MRSQRSFDRVLATHISFLHSFRFAQCRWNMLPPFSRRYGRYRSIAGSCSHREIESSSVLCSGSDVGVSVSVLSHCRSKRSMHVRFVSCGPRNAGPSGSRGDKRFLRRRRSSDVEAAQIGEDLRDARHSSRFVSVFIRQFLRNGRHSSTGAANAGGISPVVTIRIVLRIERVIEPLQ